jgi:hypothetical protein
VDHFHDPVHLDWIIIVTGFKRPILFGPGKGNGCSAQAFCGTLNPLSNNNSCQEQTLIISILKVKRNSFVFTYDFVTE